MQLAEGETIIYSGRDDDNHRNGVGILMSIIAAGSLMEWTRSTKGLFKPDSIPATLNLRSSIYAPAEDVEEQIKDEFYGRLQDVLNSVSEHDMLQGKIQGEGAGDAHSPPPHEMKPSSSYSLLKFVYLPVSDVIP